MKALMIFLMALIPSLSMADSEWKVSSARYVVPVADNLKPFSEYVIPVVHTREVDGVIEVKYDLPLELTGARNEVILKGVRQADGTLALSGPNGQTGKCDAEACHINYNSVNVDIPMVRANLMAKGIIGIELDSRILVSEAFSSDPAGIIYRILPVGERARELSVGYAFVN